MRGGLRPVACGVKPIVGGVKKYGALILGASALGASAAVLVGGLGHPGAVTVAQCRAAFGSLNGGMCLDPPPGNSGAGVGSPSGGVPAGSPSVGVPSVGIGPSADGNGPGISTSPLFPGQTFNVPLAP
jgi:hypothetical protein